MVNFFRGVLSAALIFNLYNIMIGGFFDQLSIQAWNTFLAGPILTIALAWGLLEFFNRMTAHRLPAYFWGFASFGIVLDTTTDSIGLFDSILALDKIFHFFIGGAVIGFLLIKLVEHLFAKNPSVLNIKYFLAISLTNFIGFLYETLEYIGQKYFSAGNITSIFDTTEDMLLNTAGATLVSLVYWVATRARGGKSSR